MSSDGVTVLYVRVSTGKQAEKGLSLPEQSARLRAFATAHAWDNVELVVEAKSAKDMRRPAFARVLERAEAGGVARIVSVKLDRVTRGRADAERLIEFCREHDVALVSLTENLDTSSAVGRFFVAMLANLAQLEREQTGERTATVLRFKRDRGEVYGPVPFGKRRIGNKLLDDVWEQAAIARARVLATTGMSYRAIARMLTGELHPAPGTRGRKHRSGTVWNHVTVKRILDREVA